MATLDKDLPQINYPVLQKVGDNTPFLLYFYRHDGLHWCLATQKDNGFNIINGTVGKDRVDSTYVESPALNWGIDNLSEIYKAPKTGMRNRTVRELVVRDKNNDVYRYDNIDINDYSDEEQEKLNNLYYTLYWLSNPDVAGTIDTPEGLKVAEKRKEVITRFYNHKETGLYFAVEFAGAYSFGKGFHPDTKSHNMTFLELDAVGGWKFSSSFGLGLGIGGRKYFKTNKMFAHSWGLPVFIDMRGDIMSYNAHRCVPFWVMDLGWTFPDGFMFRPQFGFKFGQPHQFTISIGYVGQLMRKYNYLIAPGGQEMSIYDGFKREYFSSVQLKIGYEF